MKSDESSEKYLVKKWKVYAWVSCIGSIALSIAGGLSGDPTFLWTLPLLVLVPGLILTLASISDGKTFDLSKKSLIESTMGLVSIIISFGLVVGVFAMLTYYLTDEGKSEIGRDYLKIIECRNILGSLYFRDEIYLDSEVLRIKTGTFGTDEYVFRVKEIEKATIITGLTAFELEISVDGKWSSYGFQFRDKRFLEYLPKIFFDYYKVPVERKTTLIGNLRNLEKKKASNGSPND